MVGSDRFYFIFNQSYSYNTEAASEWRKVKSLEFICYYRKTQRKSKFPHVTILRLEIKKHPLAAKNLPITSLFLAYGQWTLKSKLISKYLE